MTVFVFYLLQDKPACLQNSMPLDELPEFFSGAKDLMTGAEFHSLKPALNDVKNIVSK